MRIRPVLLAVGLLSSQLPAFAQRHDNFALWQKPSYFRGYNIATDQPITEQDIRDLKNDGATIVYLGCLGFRNLLSPYGTNTASIDNLDGRVSLCRAVGMRYAISVRKGPGRSDVYFEGLPKSDPSYEPPSTIWTDTTEQRLYGSMLHDIVARYAADTLFAGIAPCAEPDPFFDQIYFDTTSLKKLFVKKGVDLTAITQLWVDSIRKASPDVPVLIQGPAYTTAVFFVLVPIIHDPYAVYEFHTYHPSQFVKAADTASVMYPATFFSFMDFGDKYFDRAYLEDTFFRYVDMVQSRTGAPIFMGEFGIEFAHTGGPQFLSDLTAIAIDKGWHFAYWAYSVDGRKTYNYLTMGAPYWAVVLASFQQGGSGVASTGATNSGVRMWQDERSIHVRWDHSGYSDRASIRITDLLGRTRSTSYQEAAETMTVPTSTLSTGTYFIEMNAGDQRATAAFTVAR